MRRGFTLIEILLTVGVVSVLSSIVITAVNPTKQLGDARDAERRHNVKQLQNAQFQYLIDRGEFAGDKAIPSAQVNAMQICRVSKSDASCINVDPLIPTYIACIPYDGHETNTNFTGYRLYLDGGRATVESVYLGSGSLAGGCETLPSPVAYWRFDESAIGAQARDSSGLGHHGNSTGFASPHGPSTNIPSTMHFSDPYSVYMDGSNDYYTVATTTALDVNTTFSVTAWVFIQSPLTEDKEIFMRSNGSGGNEFNFAIEDTGVMAVHIDGTRYETTTTIPLNQWVHLAGVRSGATIRLFINGVLNTTGSPGGKTMNFGSCTTLLLGADTDSGCTSSIDNHWRGRLDEVRIYNIALTDAQVASLANGNP